MLTGILRSCSRGFPTRHPWLGGKRNNFPVLQRSCAWTIVWMRPRRQRKTTSPQITFTPDDITQIGYCLRMLMRLAMLTGILRTPEWVEVNV